MFIQFYGFNIYNKKHPIFYGNIHTGNIPTQSKHLAV